MALTMYRIQISAVMFLLAFNIIGIVTLIYSNISSEYKNYKTNKGETSVRMFRFDDVSYYHVKGMQTLARGLTKAQLSIQIPRLLQNRDIWVTGKDADKDEIARKLSKQIRVLCFVITSPMNLHKRAIHVKKTWGKRCTKLLFLSSETNISFPAIGLNTPEGRNHLTAKTMQGFRYVYDQYYDEADWFMKADDDTYVIMENLRYFLTSQDTRNPLYFGHHFIGKEEVKQGFNSGGAAYVLSKEALRRLSTIGNNPQVCKQDGGQEDLNVGKCMEKLGVKIVNTTDFLGRTRFHCYNLESHLFGNYPQWYYFHDANGAHKGMNSISNYAISFHYVKPQRMYELEFFVYHLYPYGIETGHQNMNQPANVFNMKKY